MTPAARVQTAIEILDTIAASARDGGAPADAIFAEAMRVRRYAGSKDRRAIRGLVYDAIRGVRSAPASGRAAMLALADAASQLLLQVFILHLKKCLIDRARRAYVHQTAKQLLLAGRVLRNRPITIGRVFLQKPSDQKLPPFTLVHFYPLF